MYTIVIQLWRDPRPADLFSRTDREISRDVSSRRARRTGRADASVGIDDVAFVVTAIPSFLLTKVSETSGELYDYGHRPAGRGIVMWIVECDERAAEKAAWRTGQPHSHLAHGRDELVAGPFGLALANLVGGVSGARRGRCLRLRPDNRRMSRARPEFSFFLSNANDGGCHLL